MKVAIKKLIKRAMGVMTGVALCLSTLGVMPVQAEEIFTCVLFATDEAQSIRLNVSGMNMNGDIVTNGELISDLEVSFNGTVYENQENEMLDLHSKIESLYFNGEVNHLKEDYSPEDYNENISKATYIEGNFNSVGNNVAINSAALRTTGDVYIEGGSFSCSSAVVYSEQGDIYIDSDNFSMNGLLYAPNGKIYIECGGINLGGSVIGQSIEITSAGGVNLNKNESFMQSLDAGINAVEMPERDESREGQESGNNASSESNATGNGQQNGNTSTSNAGDTQSQANEGALQSQGSGESQDGTGSQGGTQSQNGTDSQKDAKSQGGNASQGSAQPQESHVNGTENSIAGTSDENVTSGNEQTGNVRFVIDVISTVEFKNPFEMLILLYELIIGEKNIIIY